MDPENYDSDTKIEALGAGRFAAELRPGWNIGTVPNGGYVTAILGAAAVRSTPHGELLNVSTYFVKAAAAGPAEVEVEVVRAGRRTSCASVRLLQGGSERARALVLTADLDAFDGPDLHLAGPPELPPPAECLRISPDLPMVPAIMRQVELRLDPATAHFARGETGPPRLTGWLRFADGRDADVGSLPLFADVLTPTTFNPFGFSRWVPTLELTVQVRARPAAGWLRIEMTTRHISAGHLEEDGTLWDERGTLVALSRQRAMMLDAGSRGGA
jgi:acyl-CoA thioesterase